MKAISPIQISNIGNAKIVALQPSRKALHASSSISLSRFQNGMTLIEIMIALLIGAFLLGGILQVFVGTKQTNRVQENLSRLQENGRFAMSFLAKDIRMAGYWDCLLPPTPSTDIGGTNDNVGVAGIDDGTDKITLMGAFAKTPIAACGTAANTANSCTLDSDGSSVNCYTHASSTITYKINNGALQKDADAVVEDIVNMQILYGADTDADSTPNYYVAAGTAGLDMTKVVSIRITLTARTHDENLGGSGPNGTIERTFTSTIAVRNRLP